MDKLFAGLIDTFEGNNIRTMTRKEFVKICGLLGIGMPHLGNALATKVNSSEKVIVIGAGLSGLLAAVELAKKGISVTLLDSEPRLGGRIHSVPLGGTHVNLGAQYFFKSENRLLNQYVNRVDKYSPFNGLNGVLWDGQFISTKSADLFTKLPVDYKALEGLDQSIKHMQKVRKELSKGREFIFDPVPTNQKWIDLDNRNAAEYLSNYHPELIDILNMFFIPEGGAGVDETSALLLVGWYGGKVRDNYLVEGGNQKLPEMIGSDFLSLGGEINLSTAVMEIRETSSRVEVITESDKRYESDYVIVTTPATVSKEIVKGLPKEKMEAMGAVQYGASMQVGLHLKNIPADNKLISSVFHNESINAYMDQNRESHDDETVISLNIAGKEPHSLDDDGILKRVSVPLKKIYPNFSLNGYVKDFAIKKWRDGIVRFPPGFMSRYQQTLRAPFGRIFFGGDYTHNPALDGAAWSGVRAAEQVLRAINKK